LLDDAGRVVEQERFDAATVTDNALRDFRFSPEPDSAGRAYTIQLAANSMPGAANTVWSDTVDRYPGVWATNGALQLGDLALEWRYQPALATLVAAAAQGLARYGLSLLLVSLLWTLPGLALLVWLRPPGAAPWSVQGLLASAAVVSGALLVILPQLTTLAGLRLGPWAVWTLLLASLLLLLLARRREARRIPFQGKAQGDIVMRPDGITALYLTVLGLVVASRFLALHPASAPLWGDSVHHALITQLVLDRGGIPDDYLPYVPLASLTYHAGFHVLSGWLAWSVLPGTSPLSASDVVLLTGQLLNVWAIVAVGLLAEGLARPWARAGQARWAGVLAILFAGLLNPMPAFYVNWGR
ncbi:MAG: hypothetical protein ACRDIB_17340, partial [Ardenticatenaceae bacterium]